MRWVVVAVVLVLSFAMVVPAQAQVIVFTPGVYQFESYIPQMAYTGTWSTGLALTSAATVRSTSAASATVVFYVTGKYLVFWHYVPPSSASSRFDVCLSGVTSYCDSVISESAAAVGLYYPHVMALPTGNSSIQITRTAGTIYLDYFMILADPTVLTPVPTATILPSSTPAYTATPGPTPVYTATAVPTITPAPTVTPYTFPGVIYALDPAASYSSRDGMITAIDYKVDGGQIHLANLLTLLLLSVWGFFLFVLFVLVRYRK